MIKKRHNTRKCDDSPSFATSLLIELLKKLKDLASVLAQFSAVPGSLQGTNLKEVKKTSADALKVYRDYTENVRHYFDQHTILRDKTNSLGVVLTSVIRCFIISINEPNNYEILDKIDLKQLVVRVKDINQYWQTEIAPEIREARRKKRMAKAPPTKIRRSCSAGAMQRMYKSSGPVMLISQSSPFKTRDFIAASSPSTLRPVTPNPPSTAVPIPRITPPKPPNTKPPSETPPIDTTHITRITSIRSQSHSSVSSSDDEGSMDKRPTSRSSSYASTALPPLPARPSRPPTQLPTLPIPASPEQLRNYVRDMREMITKKAFTSEAQRRKAITQLRQAIKKIIALNNEQVVAPQVPKLKPQAAEKDDHTRSARSKTHSPQNSATNFHQRKKSSSFSSGQSDSFSRATGDKVHRSLHEPDKNAVAVPVEQLTAEPSKVGPSRRAQIKSTAFSNFKDLLAQTELGLVQQSSPVMSPVVSPREMPTPSIVMRDFGKIETFLDKEFEEKPSQRRSKRLTRTLSAGSNMLDKTWAPRRKYFGAIDDNEDSIMEDSMTEEEIRQQSLWMPISASVVAKPKQMSTYSLAGKSRVTSSMRDKSVMELVGTEETYVEGLKVIVEFFLKPLNKELKNAKEFGVEPLLPQEDVAKIFFLIEEILALHAPFLSKLRKSVVKDSVGKPMLKLIPKLKKYAEYAQNYNAAVKCVTKNLEERTRFRNYYDSIMKLPRVADMSLVSLLVTPIQRIPRYKLLLESIIKHTNTNHPDYYLAVKAKKEVVKAVEYVEITKKEAENSDMLVQIRNKLIPNKKKKPFILVKPGRTYLNQGILDVSCGKDRGSLHCFLFSDLLLTTKNKKSGFVVQTTFNLHGAKMLEGSSKRGDRPLLQIFCDSKEILVTFPSLVQRDKWLPFFKRVEKADIIEDVRQ